MNECTHEETAIRVFTAINGAQSYRLQCLRCGARVRDLRKADLFWKQVREAQPWDESLATRYWQQLRDAREHERQANNAQWWEQYNAYLQTPEWQEKRCLVLSRDGGLCQGCRETWATQVHHLTYRRVFREMLFDLVAVCERCHKALHATTEQAKPAAPQSSLLDLLEDTDASA